MRIYIGSDHRGFHLKAKIAEKLGRWGYDVIDVGTHTDGPCDYPKVSFQVASRVAKSRDAKGILVCMSGIGHSIAANKVPGAYAALCYDREAAMLSRQHNNANILVLGARFVPPEEINDLVKTWLTTEFEGGRHLRRVKQIKAIEKAISGNKKKRPVKRAARRK